MSYAKKLTKEDLIRDGINDIKEDGTVIRNGYTLELKQNKQGYFYFSIYNYDENGNKIKKPITRTFKGRKKSTDTYLYKTRTVCLHRAMWAWAYGEVPEGYVVDHLSNKHDSLEDYRLNNLQLLTPKANLAKERKESTRQTKCLMSKPRSFYENKLKQYEELYEYAKLSKDPKACHKQRANIANTRARLRYWEAHKEEYYKYINEKEFTGMTNAEKKADKKDLEILQNYKKEFRLAGNKAMWRQCCQVEKLWKSGELNQAAKEHVIEVLLKFGVR